MFGKLKKLIVSATHTFATGVRILCEIADHTWKKIEPVAGPVLSVASKVLVFSASVLALGVCALHVASLAFCANILQVLACLFLAYVWAILSINMLDWSTQEIRAAIANALDRWLPAPEPKTLIEVREVKLDKSVLHARPKLRRRAKRARKAKGKGSK